MSDENERFDVTVLGRVIGTCSGFDQTDTAIFIHYNFVPKHEGLGEGDMSVDYENGHFNFFDDNGIASFTLDIVDYLKEIPRE